MKKSNFLTRLFSHNFVLLITAFLLAFIAWFVINANSETETNVTISNIPVEPTLPDSATEKGFLIFKDTDYTASVQVSGNRVTVGSLTSSDIQVTANQTTTIDHAGEYTFTLSAKKVGLKTNYNIVSSVNPSSIAVFVDKFGENDLKIDKSQLKVVMDTGYYSEVTMSTDTVHIEGAASKVAEIKSVAIIDDITAVGSSPMTLQESLVFLDKNGNTIDLHYVTTDIKTVEVTVKSQPKKEVSLALNVLNAPKYAPKVTLDPDKVTIYGPKEQIDTIKDDQIVIGNYDFDNPDADQEITEKDIVSGSKQIAYSITLPSGMEDCHINPDDNVTATFDLSLYATTTFTANIRVKIDSSKYEADIPEGSTVSVTVFGLASQISELTEDDIVVLADVTKMTSQLDDKNSVQINVPLEVTVSGSSCWAKKLDPVSITVTPKTQEDEEE